MAFGLREPSTVLGLLLEWQMKVSSAHHFKKKLLQQPQELLGDIAGSSGQNKPFDASWVLVGLLHIRTH